MRMGQAFDGYPWQRILPIAMLGSGILVGAMPSYWTLDMVAVGLAAVGLVAVISHLRRTAGLALREPDGTPVRFAFALVFTVASLGFVAVAALPLIIRDWNPPPTSACLCVHPQGLFIAALWGALAVIIAGMLVTGLIAMVTAVARLALGPRPGTNAPFNTPPDDRHP